MNLLRISVEMYAVSGEIDYVSSLPFVAFPKTADGSSITNEQNISLNVC